MEDNEVEFISYKKVIIFGAKDSGKSTLSKTLETGKFSEQSPTENSKYISFFIIFYHFNSFV